MSDFQIYRVINSKSKNNIKLIIGNDLIDSGIYSKTKFVNLLLKKLSVNDKFKDFSIKEIRSNFYSFDEYSDDWENKWSIMWGVKINFSNPIQFKKSIDIVDGINIEIPEDEGDENWNLIEENKKLKFIDVLIWGYLPNKTVLNEFENELEKNNLDNLNFSIKKVKYYGYEIYTSLKEVEQKTLKLDNSTPNLIIKIIEEKGGVFHFTHL